MTESISIRDPRDVLSASPMSLIQKAAIAITVGLNALDGVRRAGHQLRLAGNRP